MFKALYHLTGEEIVILEPRWHQKIAELRLLDRQDHLVCQGCGQPVRVRAPRSRRAHFAHKHLGNCTFGLVSPELLQARAVLYEWLVTQFGAGPGVTVEKAPAGTAAPGGLPRPVDGWVETEGQAFAYWIIETRMQPDDRQRLLGWAATANARVQWVFLHSMLHETGAAPGSLLLTTTERAFLAASEYDTLEEAAPDALQGSLHYLESESSRLTTFRGLRRVHAPQVFAGRKEQSDLARVVASPRTGEFVHPGEAERLQRFRLAQEERQRRQAGRLRRLEEIQSRLAGKPLTGQSQEGQFLAKEDRQRDGLPPASNPTENRQPFARLAVCVVCGEQTTDWVTLYGATGKCICRKCKGSMR